MIIEENVEIVQHLYITDVLQDQGQSHTCTAIIIETVAIAWLQDIGDVLQDQDHIYATIIIEETVAIAQHQHIADVLQDQEVIFTQLSLLYNRP